MLFFAFRNKFYNCFCYKISFALNKAEWYKDSNPLAKFLEGLKLDSYPQIKTQT